MEEEHVHAGEQTGEGGILFPGCGADGGIDGESGGLGGGDYGYVFGRHLRWIGFC